MAKQVQQIAVFVGAITPGYWPRISRNVGGWLSAALPAAVGARLSRTIAHIASQAPGRQRTRDRNPHATTSAAAVDAACSHHMPQHCAIATLFWSIARVLHPRADGAVVWARIAFAAVCRLCHALASMRNTAIAQHGN